MSHHYDGEIIVIFSQGCKSLIKTNSLQLSELIIIDSVSVSCLQIIGLLNVFTPDRSYEEFQDLWVNVIVYM